jgi:hypothetical protein
MYLFQFVKRLPHKYIVMKIDLFIVYAWSEYYTIWSERSEI